MDYKEGVMREFICGFLFLGGGSFSKILNKGPG